MLYVMYLVHPFLDVVVDVQLDFTHGQVELIGKCFIIEDLLLYARNKTSIVIVVGTQVHLVFDEFDALLQG